MLKELLIWIEKEEKEKELSKQVMLRREKIPYLVNYQSVSIKSRNNRWVIGVFAVVLIVTEITIFFIVNEALLKILTSILAPFVISAITSALTSKLTIESKVGDIERELLEICVFLKTYDKLNDGEKYILYCLNNFKSKKYTKKNKFDPLKALNTDYS